MDFTERTLSRQEVFHGQILRVHTDTVLLPNGRQGRREVAEHPGSVAIVALDEDMGLLLVEQYRYAIGRMLLEIPAGKLAPGETPEEAAGRELQEETGAQPGSLLSLGKIYAAPGCYSEALYLFLARGLRFGQTQPDEDEFLLQRRVPFQQAVEMVLSGEIEDGKTVSAVLKARYLLGL